EGSYAGAFGLSQFMPDSFRDYAVDHDGNGQINLFSCRENPLFHRIIHCRDLSPQGI
ncbi:MAG TPA: hypothetical protein EYP16_00695, partial [Candidatus Atribacteria bacterium]|nr:hypothetical protein [Candidatus Atribacteria bacterium]